jgi:hypothetical protein
MNLYIYSYSDIFIIVCVINVQIQMYFVHKIIRAQGVNLDGMNFIR